MLTGTEKTWSIEINKHPDTSITWEEVGLELNFRKEGSDTTWSIHHSVYPECSPSVPVYNIVVFVLDRVESWLGTKV